MKVGPPCLLSFQPLMSTESPDPPGDRSCSDTKACFLSLLLSEGPQPMTTLLLGTCAAGSSGLAPPGAYVCRHSKEAVLSLFVWVVFAVPAAERTSAFAIACQAIANACAHICAYFFTFATSSTGSRWLVKHCVTANLQM